MDLAIIFIGCGADVETAGHLEHHQPDMKTTRGTELGSKSHSDIQSDTSFELTVDEDWGGNSPLVAAAEATSWTCAALLIQLGAKRSAEEVPILAYQTSRPDIVNLLFRKGCLSTMTFDLLRRIVYTRNGEEILKVLMSSEVSFYIADG